MKKKLNLESSQSFFYGGTVELSDNQYKVISLTIWIENWFDHGFISCNKVRYRFDQEMEVEEIECERTPNCDEFLNLEAEPEDICPDELAIRKEIVKSISNDAYKMAVNDFVEDLLTYLPMQLPSEQVGKLEIQGQGSFKFDAEKTELKFLSFDVFKKYPRF